MQKLAALTRADTYTRTHCGMYKEISPAQQRDMYAYMWVLALRHAAMEHVRGTVPSHPARASIDGALRQDQRNENHERISRPDSQLLSLNEVTRIPGIRLQFPLSGFPYPKCESSLPFGIFSTAFWLRHILKPPRIVIAGSSVGYH